ncbi:hypothetical protein HMSSN036_11100 [Paenibacillus macerans]|nr:hypothetical protein HMSSN036_11100 [Paenibacillus macerans]
MAIRVYPGWENPTSKQAIETQKWQLAYFGSLPVYRRLRVVGYIVKTENEKKEWQKYGRRQNERLAIAR